MADFDTPPPNGLIVFATAVLREAHSVVSQFHSGLSIADIARSRDVDALDIEWWLRIGTLPGPPLRPKRAKRDMPGATVSDLSVKRREAGRRGGLARAMNLSLGAKDTNSETDDGDGAA